jgi:hypothetical protein
MRASGTLRLPVMWPVAYSIGSRTSITVTPLAASWSAKSWALMRVGADVEAVVVMVRGVKI